MIADTATTILCDTSKKFYLNRNLTTKWKLIVKQCRKYIRLKLKFYTPLKLYLPECGLYGGKITNNQINYQAFCDLEKVKFIRPEHKNDFES